ncbi:MAG: MBL fold metallo-hydrolase [Pseudomonadota bacterium]|nr:MBL fold metallo-hydrolase [Pseudomonadota bacterium]
MRGLFYSLSLLIILFNTTVSNSKVTSTEEYARNAWGNLETAEVTTRKVNENLFLLYGLGGNIAVSTGNDGVLIVDSQIPIIFPKVMKAIKKLSDDKIIYTINTHWHWDHSDGNLVLDSDETKIISHSNARENMQKGGLINMGTTILNQEPYPKSALPVITHENGMSLYFNGEKIDLFHFGPAHTTGDTVIYFTNQNAIHLGDVFFSNSYPFIDVDNGGSLSGMINYLEKIILVIDKDTIVMPGHGEISSISDIKETIEMLKTVKNRILMSIENNQSLEEIISSNITKDFDKKYNTLLLRDTFIDRAYASLK